MNDEELTKNIALGHQNFELAANNLCAKALNEARSQLHPLVQNTELARLDTRIEFVQAFKLALEQQVAKRLAVWYPNIQAVFKFDGSRLDLSKPWDGSIHLLAKVPRLSKTLKSLGQRLDQSLINYMKRLGWSRFCERPFILEVQQVTNNELLHGIGYGAMFCAVYSVPVKVWSRKITPKT